MKKTATLAVRLSVSVAAGFLTWGAAGSHAHAQYASDDSETRIEISPPASGLSIGGALGVDLFSPRIWFEIHTGEGPAPAPPAPPCCYAPPPPVVMVAPPGPPPEADLHLGLAVAGLLQSAGTGQSTVAGVAASLQVRTSARSQFALELQSLASDRGPTRSRRDDLAGLMAGRLYAWNAALVPYLELAGGFGHASIDAQGLRTQASQIIGRLGIGLEMRLGPHLVLDTQLASLHRLRLDENPRDVAENDPSFIGHHEQATELRFGLGYRF
jgi:hypothetical protein